MGLNENKNVAQQEFLTILENISLENERMAIKRCRHMFHCVEDLIALRR